MTKLTYIAVVLAAILSVSVSVIFANQINAQQQNGYLTVLNGKNEVPSHPDVTATGMSGFIVNSGNSKVWYQIEGEGLKGVTQAHIHSGKASENGPVVATLFKGSKDTVNGALVQGSITADKLEGPLKGKSISDLVSLFDKSFAYVNVHTQSFPDGEIRGQIGKGTIDIDVVTKTAHISGGNDINIDIDLKNVNINEITVENENQIESTQTTENTLSADQTTQNTLNANQTTDNTLGANQTIEDQMGSSQSSENMLGMNGTGSEMTGTNDSMTIPSTDSEIESNPVD
ncbi:MAG TPA: CHRD domain-containing protein [Nitrososphaeraceae archaeon]|nr:CHRD domain-containing protein [Nitrososphaeraceae archaeon]